MLSKVLRSISPLRGFSSIIDLIAPRVCPVCGNRLLPDEDTVCQHCLRDIPYTNYHKDPTGNYLARLFWKRLPIERATSLFFYHPKAEYANIVYDLKYHQRPEIGRFMGEYMARSFAPDNFFEGIDYIIPVPLSRSRQRKRGCNQSLEIAKGIGRVTGIPVLDDAIVRTTFHGSQTNLRQSERQENVDGAFASTGRYDFTGRHVLLVDDIITTGATIISCAAPLLGTEAITISIISLGFTKD